MAFIDDDGIREKTVSEVFNSVIDVRGKLDPGDTVTGVVTVVSTSGITVSSPQTNTTVAQDVKGVQIPIGKAILAVISGGTATNSYTINFKIDTTLSATRYTSNIVVSVVADPST